MFQSTAKEEEVVSGEYLWEMEIRKQKKYILYVGNYTWELFFFAELAALLRAIDEVTNFPRELSEEKKTWVCVIHPRTQGAL